MRKTRERRSRKRMKNGIGKGEMRKKGRRRKKRSN